MIMFTQTSFTATTPQPMSGHSEFKTFFRKDEYNQCRVVAQSSDDTYTSDKEWVMPLPFDWNGDVDAQIQAGLALFPDWTGAVFS